MWILKLTVYFHTHKDIEINDGNNSWRSRDKVFSTIKEKLLAIKSYVEARRVIEDLGLKNTDEVLVHLGFTVQWKGLDIGAATIGLQ